MGHVRAFSQHDIPQVSALHEKVFKPAHEASRSSESYSAYFTRVFFEPPSRDAGLPSLVHEDDGGRITGFLGVAPRRMSLNGQRVNAAVSSQFIVDPSAHVALVALQLAKSFLDGPQDLSIADEANDVARRIWEGLGGTTALLHSIYWTRPLRPARLAVSFLRNRPGLAALAHLASPPSLFIDALATRLRRSQLFQAAPPGAADPLLPGTFTARLSDFVRPSALRVEYDDNSFAWLLDRAARRARDGRLYGAVIRDPRGTAGWYIYVLNVEGIADVLQIVAKPGRIDEVLDHLFYGAWRQGAAAVTGRLEPPFLQALSDKYCLLHRRGPWMLVNAKRPELVRSFQSGDAWFSRFDGEWCLGY